MFNGNRRERCFFKVETGILFGIYVEYPGNVGLFRMMNDPRIRITQQPSKDSVFGFFIVFVNGIWQNAFRESAFDPMDGWHERSRMFRYRIHLLETLTVAYISP